MTTNKEIAELANQIAALRDQLHEVKELVCTLIAHHKCAQHHIEQKPSLFSGNEKRIKLEAAVPMVWRRSSKDDVESVQIHAGFLLHWATAGLNSAVLEAEQIDGQWYTSKQAVERFTEKIGLYRERSWSTQTAERG